MKTPSHVTAIFFYSTLNIPRRTFYNRAISKDVSYIRQFRGDRLFSVKDWNKKNPDLQMPSEIDA